MLGLLRSPTRLLLAGLLVLLIPFLTGCPSKEKTGTVKGTVKVDGALANSGIVTFVSSDTPPTTLSAPIDPDGNYQANMVPIGTMKVTVKPVEVPKSSAGIATPSMKDMPGESSKPPAKPVPIPAKYGKVETSGLTHNVTGGTTTFNIELSNK